MPTLPANSVDTIITDPPYGLSFMGKAWDKGVPGEPFWREALRAAKPGAMLMAFGGTRTHHRLMCAIEDAGWELRDCMMWLHGQGFPKSHDISKAIDKAAGAERRPNGARKIAIDRWTAEGRKRLAAGDTGSYALPITAPATPSARQWHGYGTALKPAWEPIILAMKPLDGTFAANAEKWGVAGLWIDGGRIEHNEPQKFTVRTAPRNGAALGFNTGNKAAWRDGDKRTPAPSGRFPANLILDERAAEMLDEQSGASMHGAGKTRAASNGTHSGPSGLFGLGAPAMRFGDTGGASRFFYTAKASRKERTAGGTVENSHPTVKPVAILEYLCKLTRTPTGGTVLDPFMGSGSTGVACKRTGREFIGIEKEAKWCEVAEHRIGQEQQQTLLSS